MSRKSGIATYGYRDQNDFQSSVGLVCEAITNSSSGSDKDIIKQLVESVNLIYNKAIVDAAYNGDNKEFEFNNYYGAEVDRFKFPYLVDTAEYDADSKKIIIKFEDETVDPIEIDLSAIVESGDVDTRLDEEISARTQADQEIWDAIGDLSGSTETSGKTLLELIKEEISARTETDDRLEEEISARTSGDAELWEALIAETEARKADDDAIWEAIGSGSTIMDIINAEISARTSADTELWEAVNILAESAITLTENDAKFVHDLGEEINARSQADNALAARLIQEINDRQVSESAISSALSSEISAREANDAWLNNKINQEISDRIAEDNQLRNDLNEEISARTQGDETLSGAIDTEKAERIAADDVLSGAIDSEIINRESGDIALSGAIDTEKAERIAGDEALSGAVDTEKSERENGDIALSGAITTERTERENADLALSGAIADERDERIAIDEALSGSIDANKVSIVKVETALPANVREAYELKNTSGEVLGERVNIYKDSSLKDVELIDHDDSGHTGQFLMFTYILEDGSEKVEYVNVSQFLVEAEFKDGLTANTSGEISVKIDPSSESGLTVSQHGVKLSGIYDIADRLTRESNVRYTKDTALETAILTERTRALSAESVLESSIEEEVTAREDADIVLDGKITRERQRALSAESVLESSIATERTDRINDDQDLFIRINRVSDRLDIEKADRERKDSDLEDDINELKTKNRELSGSITTLDERVTTEVEYLEAKDRDLEAEIRLKVDKSEVYTSAEADSIFATKDEIPTDFYSKSEVDAKDNEVKALINSEASTREAEDVRLNNAITAETSAREAADTALQNNIDALETQLNSKLVEVKAKDPSIAVDSTNATKPEIKVNISTEEDQIIKLNADGIYAKSKLSYDEENNILIYTNTTGTTAIVLKTKSEIHRIYYDKPNERIVIEYIVNGQPMPDVVVPVHDLIEEWRTEDGNVGAIALTKDISIPEVDVLKARLILNTAHGDNAAVIDGDSLYVSKNAIVAEANAEIEALKARVTALENALSAATQVHQQINNVNDAQTQRMDEMDELIDYLQTLHQP